MGTFRILIPVSGTSSIAVDVDVVTLDIPFLLGKSTLAENRFTIYIHGNNTITEIGDIPLVDDGHLMLQWNPKKFLKVFYTPGEIRNLHRHFLHPSASKLYEILKRSDPNLSSETRELIT
jgi:hypothetical protein